MTREPSDILLAVGLDGAKSGWIGACLHEDEGGLRTMLRMFPDIDAVVRFRRDAGGSAPVALDVPIGLSDTNSHRPCDLAARDQLGLMRSSVFVPPARFLHATTTHRDALDLIRTRQADDPTIKSISAQAYGIIRKVAEVDRYVLAHPESEHWLIGATPS